ncbi:hypothetical protein A3L04_07360 [Thermococcus chitonophagus]|uniref:UPF0212 protein A3L04_07360 n=1 Tax=Thermococcus chitonophagus TaxID=54262 RepID=A0A160VTR7_9EURY|nr:DUF555 domain-containing protein [Thermococcus chitonophagus]ASJ16902.1 hypothetical protein A3L04_07360 [Thermococcus chitonophagus]CUX78382.1 Uncharacterized protein MJ0068 [Thermococcus chitonophagus]
MGDYIVVLEAPIIVKDVRDVEEAIEVAANKVISALEKEKLDFVRVEIGYSKCPVCGAEFESAFVVGNVGLVGIYLTLKVFNAQSLEHAERIAKAVVGKALKKVPLKLYEIHELNNGGENGGVVAGEEAKEEFA